MENGITSGLAAIIGAFVGGLMSLASTWLGEQARHRRDLFQKEVAKRETTYSEFIERAAKLYVVSATHSIGADEAELEGPISLYAVTGRIRLFSSDQVITEAEKVIDQIIMQYGDDNISVEQLRTTVKKEDDPLKAFSITCRRELQAYRLGT